MGRDSRCFFANVEPYKISISVGIVAALVSFFLLDQNLFVLIVVSAVVTVVVSVILLFAREFLLLKSNDAERLEYQLDALHSWLQEIGSLVGVRRVSLVYLLRENTQVKLIQIGSLNRPLLSNEIISLYHRMAWSIPVGVISEDRSVAVILPWCILRKLLTSIRRDKKVTYLEVKDTIILKLSYHLIKNILKSLYNVSSHLLAYLAVKIYTRAILEGIIRLSYAILPNLDKLLPPENILTKYVVVRQLNEEKKLLLSSNST